MTTYRSLFANAEFRALFVARLLLMVSAVMGTFTLGVVMFDQTHSPFLTALVMFGGPLVQLVTSRYLLASSDLLRPRTAMMLTGVVAACVDSIQVIPSLPWWLRFVLVAVMHAALAATSGTTVALLSDIVPKEAFVLGRATLNMTVSTVQVVGNALGAVLLLWMRPTNMFLISAGAAVVAVVGIRIGLRDYPPRAAGAVVARTHEINARLLGSPRIRAILLMAWVPNGIIVGCEAVYIPYAHADAGYLFSTTAAGMLLGDVVIGRFVSETTRQHLLLPLRMLLAAPFLVFFLYPPIVLAALLGGLAAIGYAASLPLQERLVAAIDPDTKGQAFGLLSTGIMIGQAAGALVIGAIADIVGAGTAMTIAALLAIVTSLMLMPALRETVPDDDEAVALA